MKNKIVLLSASVVTGHPPDLIQPFNAPSIYVIPKAVGVLCSV